MKLLKNKLSKNMFALYSAHAARYLMPLITLPYLVRVLGVHMWGIVAFVLAYRQYISILVEFGFGLSGTRDISHHRESKVECGRIFKSVICAQIGFATLGILITILIQPFITILTNHSQILWLGAFAGIFQGLNLLWFYQGLEEMGLISVLNIISRIIAIIFIFVFVHSPKDAYLVFISYLIGNLTSFLIALWFAIKKISYFPCKFMHIIDIIKKGWLMFIVRINGIFFSAGNTLILGFVASPEVIGYFAAAERIGNAVRGLLNPAVQTIYPRINYLVNNSLSKAVSLIKKELLILCSIGFIMGIILFAVARPLSYYYLGENMLPSVTVLKILSFLPFIIAFNLVLGSHWLLSMRKDRLYMFIGIRISLINLLLTILVIIFFPEYAHIGAAVAIVFSQAVAAVNLLNIAFKKDSVCPLIS